jgi:hypothetical protein
LRDREFFLAALAGMLLTNVCLSATSLGMSASARAARYEHMLSQPTTALEIVFGKLTPHVGHRLRGALLAVGLAGWCSASGRAAVGRR